MIVPVVFGPIAFCLMYNVSDHLYQGWKASCSKLPREQPRKHERDKKVSVCSSYGDSRRSNGRSAITSIVSMLLSKD